MRRFFCGLDRRSHNDGEIYGVQSMPETQQPSRRPEDCRVTQSRLQTSIELVPYDHSPKGSPGTRQSRSHTGYATTQYNDRFRDKRNKSSHIETNRSAVEEMGQKYEDQIHNLQVKIQDMEDELQQCHNSLRQYKNKQEESERRKHFLGERQVEQEKEITRQKEAKIQLQNDNKLLQNQIINEQSELQDTKIRLQQCQNDLQCAQEENKRFTDDKIHLENKITQLKQSNDRLNTENGRLKADISKVQGTRQLDQKPIQPEKERQYNQRASTETIPLQNKLHDTEQSLRQTEKKLQDMELSLQQCESDYMSAIEEIEGLRKQSEDTTTKLGEEINKNAHLQADVTQLKDAHDRAQQNNIDLKAVIKQLKNDNHRLTRQTDQNRLQTDKMQKETSQRERNDNETLPKKLHDTERTLKETKSKLQETEKRLQQYQKDLKSALEQKKQETHIKTQLQTELKQQNEVNDNLQKDKERLNADITKLENVNQHLARQMEQNSLQTEEQQKEDAKRMTNDITSLQNELRHSEQALKDTKRLLQETEFSVEQLQQEKQILEARNAEHDIIQTENDRMKKEMNDLQEALDREQKSKHKLSDDYNAVQQRFREVNHEFNKTKTRLQQSQEQIQSLQEENTQIQNSLDSQWSKERDALKTDNDKLHEEKDQLNAENNRLQNQVAELRYEHSQLQADNAQLKKQMNDYATLQNKLFTTEQECNTAKLELKETKDRLRDTLKSNSTDDSKLSNLQQANSELKSCMAKLEYRNGQLMREMENLQRRLNDVDILQHKLHRVEGELKSAEAELEDTKTRLSKCMGDQLTNNNPNIVDLSDMNRPSKLADRYKELYDNQWTDAYEILEESVETEEQIISILLNILIETKRFCDNQTENEMYHILRTITRKDRWQQSDVPVGVIKYIKDCRKSTVAETMKTKYKDYVDDLQRSQKSFVKHALRIDAYLLECFEVCWLMAIQDPPVVLAPVLKHGDNFKVDLYSAYTVTGKIVDYVVWPALLLHTNGPTLTKGVAQGMKER